MENFGYVFNWQRQFFVTDHIKHKNGYTLYKVTSVVFPKKNPEAGTKIVVWKRYNEFKKLYKELKRRHSSLHIGEEFPPLPKSTFFDRFSEQVIRDRKLFISSFLNFIATCPSLFTADIFVKFFQEGYSISEYDNRQFDKDDVSIDNEVDSDIDFHSFLIKLQNMGQVLNSEGSQSSDESQSGTISKKLKIRSCESAMLNKFKTEITYNQSRFNFHNRNTEENNRFSYDSKINHRGMPEYWEEAVAHVDEAHQQEILGNYEVAFAMYKTAIVCLLSGVQGDSDVEHRMRVKELTSQYLLQAEWIYNNHLVFENKPSPPNSCRIPWRSRSQLKRYKVLNVLNNNLLVHDIVDDVFVVIKGVLKSSCPLDRSEICVLPKDVPYMVRLLALHETETTIFFVLEHVRYGKLWNHLEHYFSSEYAVDNLDTEITLASPQEKEDNGSDLNSLASSGSSINGQSLSRLESSIYTDTMSCESLSSHDENYFDLIEDYARAKSQKLKEIQDFNERRKHVESLRPVKKTVSQVDLKSLDDNYEQHRSQSLTDLAHENEDDTFDNGTQIYRNMSSDSINDKFRCVSDEEKGDKDFSSIDMDTKQLLRNAQKLIESINETLSKNENKAEQQVTESSTNDNISNCRKDSFMTETEENSITSLQDEWIDGTEQDTEKCQQTFGELSDYSNFNQKMKELNLYSPITPVSDSVPSITEEYSITAVLQRNGVTNEIIKKWATQILVALDILHRNGVICRDLNPNNILLDDNGSVKLTYFFRYPNVDPSLSPYAKERLYVAPEVDNTNSSVTFASDWWSFGAILYELITLQNLYKNHPGGINSHTIINIPDKVQMETKSLLLDLLRYDPNERLGSGISGADDIKSHPYFSEINWDEL